MIDLATDIHSMTEFKRNTSGFTERLRQTGRPVVLTVNGKAEVVVQDAAAYQRLLEAVDRAEAIEGIRRGLEAMHRGEGQPVDEALIGGRAEKSKSQNVKIAEPGPKADN
ncbi:MAG: type II toxin-antitoxin system Phd/YefM family antitoxin [Phycisphaerae bacterium]